LAEMRDERCGFLDQMCELEARCAYLEQFYEQRAQPNENGMPLDAKQLVEKNTKGYLGLHTQSQTFQVS